MTDTPIETASTVPAAPAEASVATEAPQPREQVAEADQAAETTRPDELADGEPKRGLEKRIAQLVRQRHEAERRAQMLQDELERLRNTQAPPPRSEAASVEPDEPDPAKYPLGVVDEAYHRDLRAYQRVLAERRAEMAVQQTLRDIVAQQAQAAEQQRLASLAASYEARVAQSVADMEAYREADATVQREIINRVPNHEYRVRLAEAIAAHEDGPRITMHLGKNPDELNELVRMPLAQAILRIARIGERIAAQRAEPTRAPSPPRTVRGQTATSGDPLSMSQEDFERRLRSMLRR